ncbi:MAG: glycosyltransferase family 2 protein [Trueperaceae bacterium]|nr:glycosyltransferase family 2 protein [Trueperaceae bacterium]
MSVADAAFLAVAAFLATQGAVLALNLVAFPVVGARGRPRARARTGSAARPGSGPRPRVSLLVPARDEAATLPSTLPTWLAQGADEVLVLDDGSRDATPRLVADAAAGAPALRLLRGMPLPAGWSGKNWACHQLAGAATGDVLVFTDADVAWSPGALERVVAELAATDAGLLTVWPRQRCESLGERLLVPLVDLLLLANLPHPLVRALPFASLAAANGQVMAWRREAYARVGGHAARPAEVLEDVRLAQRAKRLGVPLTLRLGGPWVATRMYRGWGDVVAGFGKNVLAAAGGSPAALVAIWALNLVAYTAPWLVAWFDPRWWALAGAGIALRMLANAKSGRPVVEALLQPAGPVALTAVVARALARRGGYAWKGRTYP